MATRLSGVGGGGRAVEIGFVLGTGMTEFVVGPAGMEGSPVRVGLFVDELSARAVRPLVVLNPINKKIKKRRKSMEIKVLSKTLPQKFY